MALLHRATAILALWAIRFSLRIHLRGQKDEVSNRIGTAIPWKCDTHPAHVLCSSIFSTDGHDSTLILNVLVGLFGNTEVGRFGKRKFRIGGDTLAMPNQPFHMARKPNQTPAKKRISKQLLLTCALWVGLATSLVLMQSAFNRADRDGTVSWGVCSAVLCIAATYSVWVHAVLYAANKRTARSKSR
jgi:hypothetical protein